MINIFRGPLSDQAKEFSDSYFIVTYWLKSQTNLRDAAWNLAIGQSVGNPNQRSEFETDELFEHHSCLVLADEKELLAKKEGVVDVAFPQANINFATDGISQLLVQIMGGQADIDLIESCVIKDLRLTPSMRACLKGPVIGLKEMKAYCGVPEDRILLGGITKPKVGLSPGRHLELVKQLVDGGCNFIKEDEILSDPAHCPIEKRVPLVMDYIHKTNAKVFYCVSISSDPAYILERVKLVHELGGNGIHVNFHCGMGVYKSIRELNLPLLMHFQKSGDKILTTGPFSISDRVLYLIAGMSGCSTLHVGMIGGYLNDETERTKRIVNELNAINCVPALSCGMHPGLVDYIKQEVGHANWMANVGGALTSHPMGTLAGVKAMRQAIDGNYGPEYDAAIKKWGKK
jgi:ribulose-bisphosphate carboxylase large chain